MWVNRPLSVSQLGRLSLSSFRVRWMSSKLQLDGRYYNSVVAPSGERLRGTEVEAGMVLFAGKTV